MQHFLAKIEGYPFLPQYPVLHHFPLHVSLVIRDLTLRDFAITRLHIKNWNVMRVIIGMTNCDCFARMRALSRSQSSVSLQL
jgi:hypothetical protein